MILRVGKLLAVRPIRAFLHLRFTFGSDMKALAQGIWCTGLYRGSRSDDIHTPIQSEGPDACGGIGGLSSTLGDYRDNSLTYGSESVLPRLAISREALERQVLVHQHEHRGHTLWQQLDLYPSLRLEYGPDLSNTQVIPERP